jgi:hypothetical protein
MPTTIPVGFAALTAVAAFSLASGSFVPGNTTAGNTSPYSTPPSATAPQDPQPKNQPQNQPQDPRATARGHLVLVIEGDVTQLRITHAVQKPDRWAGVPKGLTSEFALVVQDQKGKGLVRVPIDLSAFETDPAKIGTPVVVNGCEVRSTSIGVLLNVPSLPDAARYVIVRDKATLGTATAAELDALLRRVR